MGSIRFELWMQKVLWVILQVYFGHFQKWFGLFEKVICIRRQSYNKNISAGHNAFIRIIYSPYYLFLPQPYTSCLFVTLADSFSSLLFLPLSLFSFLFFFFPYLLCISVHRLLTPVQVKHLSNKRFAYTGKMVGHFAQFMPWQYASCVKYWVILTWM